MLPKFYEFLSDFLRIFGDMGLNHSNRVYGLDVMRAAAIIIVVLGHGATIAGPIFDWLPAIPLINGVELFFVLSGFLIGGILIRTIEKEQRFTFKSLIQFWIRRWFRTLPNYYLVLIINIPLVYFAITPGDASQINWKFFFFLQNFESGFVDFFWESWSLSIEEWFYISLPILAFVFTKILKIKWAILTTLLVLIIAPLAYRIYLSPVEYDSFWVGVEISKVVLTRLDAIVYGVLGAFIKFYYPNFWKALRWPGLIIGLFLAYLNIYLPSGPNQLYFRTISFCVTSLGVMLIIPMMDSIKNYRVPVIGRVITHISLISYGMYLVHLGIVAMLIETFFSLETTPERISAYTIYWAGTIALSTLIFYVYERPMTNLRDRFRKS